MIQPRVRLQLTDTNEGYLDLAENADVPLNFSVAEIRDLTKRKGTFSKTIRLAGSKNNHKLLSQLFDVNIVDGSFDINKLQRCQIIQDGTPILQNAYFQLVAVKKSQTNGQHDQYVEYAGVVKDGTADFFTRLGNAELTDLEFKGFDHLLNATNISNSWSHTWQDVYKYVMPYPGQNNNVLDISEWTPGIFAKQYWDRIFASAGFQCEWPSQFASDIQFDKLIVPYNGDKPTWSNDEIWGFRVEAITSSQQSYSTTSIAGANSSIPPLTVTADVELLDPSNLYDPSNGSYSVNSWFSTTSNSFLGVQIEADYVVELINLSNTQVGLDTISQSGPTGPSGPVVQAMTVRPFISMRRQNLTTPPSIVENPNSSAYQVNIPWGTILSPLSTTQVASGTIQQGIAISDVTPSDVLVPIVSAAVSMGSLRWITSSSTSNSVQVRLRLTSFRLRISPNFNGVMYNVPITLQKFIPKKIKQSDFVKSIMTLFNLYIFPDKNDPNKLIVKTRDEYYDTGVQVDWTKKLNKEKSQELQFLPELTSKKITLSYKPDKDVFNEGYLANVQEIYGQQDFTYDNEYIKGESKKELIFSPTPIIDTSFGAFTPAIVGAEPKNNIRLLYDGGLKSCSTWQIVSHPSVLVNNFTNYPYFGHFDDPTVPTFDINFGVCDYYFYSTNLWFGSVATTNNNMYNLHWRRTINQVNKNKMLTAFFDLNVRDIANLDLSHKIRIDNSWWNINRVIDYNPNKKGPTKVELISIDDELKLAPFITRRPILPIGGVILNPVKDISGIRRRTININLTPVSPVIGIGNTVIIDSVVVGDKNKVSARSVIVGDNYTADREGLYAGGYFIPKNGDYPERVYSYIIDGGRDVAMNLDKLNLIDIIDGGRDTVRRMDGDSKDRPIINGNTKDT